MKTGRAMDLPYLRGEGVIARKILGETLLVRAGSRVADFEEIVDLNETGAFVWERLDGHADARALAQALAAEYDVGEEEARRDVEALLADLAGQGLVAPALEAGEPS